MVERVERDDVDPRLRVGDEAAGQPPIRIDRADMPVQLVVGLGPQGRSSTVLAWARVTPSAGFSTSPRLTPSSSSTGAATKIEL